MATTTFRSELVYRAPKEEIAADLGKPKLGELIQKGVDAVVEYPGSRKGDFGEWRLTDWFDGKIQQIARKGGTEIK